MNLSKRKGDKPKEGGPQKRPKALKVTRQRQRQRRCGSPEGPEGSLWWLKRTKGKRRRGLGYGNEETRGLVSEGTRQEAVRI